MVVEIMATLWPTFPHWDHFAKDSRLKGIRLNTAMADPKTVPDLLKKATKTCDPKSLYFDVKGRQLRANKIETTRRYGAPSLKLTINHKIEVETPTTVIFKSGEDHAFLREVEGDTLYFGPGEESPEMNIVPGESLNIRHPSLKIHGNLFPEKQLRFLDSAMKAGITKYMLSFARSMEELDEMREVVGPDAEIIAKIEDQKGLDFVRNDYFQKKRFFSFSYNKPENTGLLCARGDLFVELEKPHDILNASRLIIKRDPDAILGSRILLSVTNENVPECADLSEVAWLMDIGYKRFMFCDELCLKEDALDRAISILDAISKSMG